MSAPGWSPAPSSHSEPRSPLLLARSIGGAVGQRAGRSAREPPKRRPGAAGRRPALAHRSRRGSGRAARGGAPPRDAEALMAIEAALGVDGAEAVRGLVGAVRQPPEASPAAVTFHVAELAGFLDGEQRETRERVRRLLTTPEFAYRSELGREAYRAQVLAWCHRLAAEGLGPLRRPSEHGGGGAPAAFFAASRRSAIMTSPARRVRRQVQALRRRHPSARDRAASRQVLARRGAPATSPAASRWPRPDMAPTSPISRRPPATIRPTAASRSTLRTRSAQGLHRRCSPRRPARRGLRGG